MSHVEKIDWTHAPLGDGSTYLYPHQRDGARWMIEGERWRLLASKPRMGKSLITIAAANVMLSDYGGSMVVVCPAGLRVQWKANIDKWRDGNWKAYVLSYNDIVAGKVRGLPETFDIAVIDEAHFAKEKDSLRTKALYGPYCREGGLVERARYVWLLTGTPMPNHAGELWPMLRRLEPNAIIGVTGRPASYIDFLSEYCRTVRTNRGYKVVGGKSLAKLKKILEPHMLVQDYDLMPSVPIPPVPELVYVQVAPEDVKMINELENSNAGRAIRAALINGGVKALQKLTTNAATLRRLFGLAKVQPVVDMVQAELENDPGLKIIVFAVHIEVAEALRKRLTKFGAVGFTGGMTPAQQREVKKQLNENPQCRVVVASLVAAAEGHDFSAASMSIRAESSWVPSQNEQADRRIFNLGKREPIVVKAIAVKNSIDEAVLMAVQGKARMSAQVFGA